MPTTGVDFSRQVDIKSDKAYFTYFNNTKKNDIIREATDIAIDWAIKNNDRIQVQMDLFGIYKPNQVATPASNIVSLLTDITDCFRVMNIKAKFIIPFSGNYISEASNSTPIRITLARASNLASGEMVVISGVTTNTAANGVRYVKKVSPTLYRLYSDANLTVPVAGNGIYSGVTGSISRVVYNQATNLKTNRKFTVLDSPSYYTPEYEIGNTELLIYPETWACSEVTVDYISTPPAIDVADGVVDLEETYQRHFLDRIANETVLLMAKYSAAPLTAQAMQSEIDKT